MPTVHANGRLSVEWLWWNKRNKCGLWSPIKTRERESRSARNSDRGKYRINGHNYNKINNAMIFPNSGKQSSSVCDLFSIQTTNSVYTIGYLDISLRAIKHVYMTLNRHLRHKSKHITIGLKVTSAIYGT